MVCFCFPRRAKENFVVKFLLIVVTGIVFVSAQLDLYLPCHNRRQEPPLSEAFLTFGSHAKTGRTEQSEQRIAVTLFSLAT